MSGKITYEKLVGLSAASLLAKYRSHIALINYIDGDFSNSNPTHLELNLIGQVICERIIKGDKALAKIGGKDD